MQPFHKEYPAYKFDTRIDPVSKIPNTYFNIISLYDSLTQYYNQQIHSSDFKLDIYTDENNNKYSIKHIMKQDYKNYFLFLTKNDNLTDATLLTETNNTPFLNIMKKDKYFVVAVYDYNLGEKYLRQKIIIDFNTMTIIYENIIIRTY